MLLNFLELSMANLGFPWHVEAVSSTTNLHIHEGCSESRVIITTGKKTCLLYDAEQREPLATWSCKPREELTCGAVYDTVLAQYAIIINSKAVRMWTFDDLDSAEKTHFASKLHCLLNTPRFGSFVVFSNGQVESLCNAFKESKESRESILANDEVIVHCNIIDGEEIQVGVVAVDEKTKQHSFCVFVFDSKGTKTKHVKYDIDVKLDIVASCLHKNSCLTFLALASDNNLHIFKPCESEEGLDKVVLNLPFGANQGNLSMLSLENDHIAILQPQTDAMTITLWDFRFKVKKSLREISPTKFFKLWNAARHLFFISELGLHALPYIINEPLLSSVIGLNSAGIKNDSIVEANWFEETVPFKNKNWNKKPMRHFPPDVRNTVHSLLDQGQSVKVISTFVFTSLLKIKATKDIVTALQIFNDVSEEVIVQVLEYFLSDIVNENGGVISDSMAKNLNLILNLPFNDVQLFTCLQNLSLTNIKMLLEYLGKCLNSTPTFDDKHLACVKVIEWLCVLLDSQFYALTLSRDDEINCMISDIDMSVKNQIKFLNEMETLETLVNRLSIKPPKCKSRDLSYSISILSNE